MMPAMAAADLASGAQGEFPLVLETAVEAEGGKGASSAEGDEAPVVLPEEAVEAEGGAPDVDAASTASGAQPGQEAASSESQAASATPASGALPLKLPDVDPWMVGSCLLKVDWFGKQASEGQASALPGSRLFSLCENPPPIILRGLDVREITPWEGDFVLGFDFRCGRHGAVNGGMTCLEASGYLLVQKAAGTEWGLGLAWGQGADHDPELRAQTAPPFIVDPMGLRAFLPAMYPRPRGHGARLCEVLGCMDLAWAAYVQEFHLLRAELEQIAEEIDLDTLD